MVTRRMLRVDVLLVVGAACTITLGTAVARTTARVVELIVELLLTAELDDAREEDAETDAARLLACEDAFALLETT